MDESFTVLPDAFVGVEDGRIVHLSQTPPAESVRPETIIDAAGMVMLPGLINCRTRLTHSLLRGVGDDLDRRAAVEDHILPAESRTDPRTAEAAALLSIAECLRFGVTSVSDQSVCCDAVAKAAADSGIKACLCPVLSGGPEQVEREFSALRRTWHGYDRGRIRIDAGIPEAPAGDPQIWELMARAAAEDDLGMQITLSETREAHESWVERTALTPSQTMDCHRVLEGRTSAAHCVHLTEADMALLGKRKVTAVFCPVADGKTAAGQADAVAMVRCGMNVALGTDSALFHNNLDLWEDVKAAVLAARTLHGPGAFPAPAALMTATVCGARAQGRERECGMLKVGMDADLCLLDLSQPHLIPCHDLMSHAVYAASGRDVAMTMVRGKILYSAGKFPTIDLTKVMKELTEYAVPKLFDPQPEEEPS